MAAEGKRSGPSDYAVAPRPVIYSKPALEAKVGVEYRGQVGTDGERDNGLLLNVQKSY